jgi:uncharacterized protein
MKITFAPSKRSKTLAERGLDFADAGKVFAGRHVSRVTHGGSSGEKRFITAGFLDRRMVVIV